MITESWLLQLCSCIFTVSTYYIWDCFHLQYYGCFFFHGLLLPIYLPNHPLSYCSCQLSRDSLFPSQLLHGATYGSSVETWFVSFHFNINSFLYTVYSFNSLTRRKLARGLRMKVTNASTLQEFAVPGLVLITHFHGTAVSTMPTGRPVTQSTVSHTLTISSTKSCPFSLWPMSLVTSSDGTIGTFLWESLHFWEIPYFSIHFFCVINHTALLFNLISPQCIWESLPILSFASFWNAWFV